MDETGIEQTEIRGREQDRLYRQAAPVRLLVAGMARSGTTVLQRLASEISGLFVARETHFWRYAAGLAMEFGVPLSPSDAEDAFAWFLAKESSEHLDLDPRQLAQALGDESYLWDLFQVLVRSLCPPGGRILGEKTPDHLRWSEQLLRSVPDLRLAAVVRDPREVFRSHKSIPWGLKDPQEFSAKWVELSRRLRDNQRLFGDRVFAYRYEEMVAQPDRARTELASLVGLDADTGVAAVAPDALFDPAEWWKKDAAGQVVEKKDKWLTELDEETVGLIEAVCEEEMARWGYELTSLSQSRSYLPDPSPDSEIRRSSAVIDATPLPITQAQMEDWKGSMHWSSRLWRVRANASHERSKILQTRLEGSQNQVTNLRMTNKGLESEVGRLNENLKTVEARAEVETKRGDRWHQRAQSLERYQETLQQRIEEHERARLVEKRRRLVAEGKLRRLRARKWWRLAGVLSRWRKSPLRIDRLVAEVWKLAFDKTPLPPAPDLSAIDRRISQVTEETSDSGASLTKVKSLITDGDYESALEMLTTLPDKQKNGMRGRLLARNALLKLGEITRGLAALQEAIAIRGDDALIRQARILEGRIVETDTSWLPDPGPSSKRPDFHGRRILHVIKESLPYFERGYTMRSHTSFLAQQQAGYEPIAATSLNFPRDHGIETFAPVDVVDGIPYHRLDLGSAYPTTQVPYDLRLSDHAAMVLDLAEEVGPAVIQAGSGYRGYETALVAMGVARKLDLPFIYEIRSFLEHTWTGEIERSEQGEYYQRRFAQEVRCLSEADHVITIAEAMKDEIVERGISRDKVTVIPNVVDVERFRPRPKNKDLLKRYGLADRVVLGYISNIGQREGIETLVDAVALLREGGMNVAGLVAGEGPELPELRERVREHGLEESFILPGHVPNELIEEHYSLIDIFVVPRIDDRASRMVTPLKPLEAMAMNIPVIVSDLPALVEMVEPGVRGNAFTSGDPQALARVVAEALDNPNTTSDLAHTARDWVLRERTLASNAERLKAVFSGFTG